jgi:hypothetical protein
MQAQQMLTTLIKAVEANDYDSFAAQFAPEFKAKLGGSEGKKALESANTMFAARFKKGYEAKYLDELKQQGAQYHVWKLVFKDGGDETLARLILKEGKVAGFWLQ